MPDFKCTLLIDDDPITNYINYKIVKKSCISEDVKLAVNGLDGFKIIEDLCSKPGECPDLILLDINMPVMNGLDFLKEIRNLKNSEVSKSRIVVLTTSTHEKDLGPLQGFNVTAVLNKPLTIEKLKSIII